MFVIDTGKIEENDRIYVIIHGFPSSSFEYHRVLDKLAKYGRVVVFDHIGFGLSEKPRTNYGYTL